MGLSLYGLDSAIRLCFEFLPMPWLRTYRQFKAWFKTVWKSAAAAEPRSEVEEFLNNKATLLLSAAILTVVAFAHHLSGFAVTLMPFYMIPAAILTLVMNQRWGTVGAVISTITWTALQMDRPSLWRFLASGGFVVGHGDALFGGANHSAATWDD